MSQTVHTYADIFISPYEFSAIQELRITKELNEHAKLYIQGTISEDKLDHYVEGADNDEWIDISVIQEDKTVRLFQGVVTHISVQAVRNIRSVAIEAVSSTFLMDIHKKSRSFQNKSMGYDALFSSVTSEYPKSDMLDQVTHGRPIGQLLVQYKETDWEFVKRLASHFYAPLAPICGVEGIKVYIGVADQPARHRLDEFNYKVKNDLMQYRLKSAGDIEGLQEQDFIRYEVMTEKIIELCDAVEFKGKKLFVYHAETHFTEGILKHTYQLMDAKGFSQRKRYNPALAGISLFGSVLDVSKDQVKVHLEIDEAQDQGGASWFPYSTVYSSPDGSGWYCMPEIGDHIRVQFPDEREDHAFAASSVNLSSSDSQKRSDPAVKSIGTKYGKQIIFQPGAIEIIGGGKLLMRLTDDGGIEINSDKKISLSALEDIEINGSSKIVIQGDAGIDLKQANAALSITENVTISGGKVNIE